MADDFSQTHIYVGMEARLLAAVAAQHEKLQAQFAADLRRDLAKRINALEQRQLEFEQCLSGMFGKANTKVSHNAEVVIPLAVPKLELQQHKTCKPSKCSSARKKSDSIRGLLGVPTPCHAHSRLNRPGLTSPMVQRLHPVCKDVSPKDTSPEKPEDVPRSRPMLTVKDKHTVEPAAAASAAEALRALFASSTKCPWSPSVKVVGTPNSASLDDVPAASASSTNDPWSPSVHVVGTPNSASLDDVPAASSVSSSTDDEQATEDPPLTSTSYLLATGQHCNAQAEAEVAAGPGPETPQANALSPQGAIEEGSTPMEVVKRNASPQLAVSERIRMFELRSRTPLSARGLGAREDQGGRMRRSHSANPIFSYVSDARVECPMVSTPQDVSPPRSEFMCAQALLAQ